MGELQQNNVVAIVSLGGYNPYFENKNIEYLQLAVRDRAAESLFDAFKQSNEFIHAKRDRKSKKAVLIHCFGGRSRSAAICAAYLMEHENMSMIEALAAIVK